MTWYLSNLGMALTDSVVSGYLMIWYLSNLGMALTDFLGYLGSRFLIKVFGLKKCTLVRTFLVFLDTEFLMPLATFPAFLAPSPSAFAPFFGAMFATERTTVGNLA